MRYLITLFLLCPLLTYGQSFLPAGSTTQGTYQRGGYGADSVFGVPVGDTIPRFTGWRNIGRIMVNDNDSQFYYNNGTEWVRLSNSTDIDTSVFQLKSNMIDNLSGDATTYLNTPAVVVGLQTNLDLSYDSINRAFLAAPTGFKAVADTSTIPTLTTGAVYRLSNYPVLVTYTKFDGITVDTNQAVDAIYNGTTWQKYVYPDAPTTYDKYTYIAKNTQVSPYSILVDTGIYILNSADSTNYPTDSVGYIIPTTGLVFTSTSSFKYSRFIDVTGYSYVYHRLTAGSAGYAFYDASKAYISGNTGSSTYQYLPVPTGAKYFRSSKNNSVALSDAGIYLRNIYTQTNPEEITFYKSGVPKTYIAKQYAVEFGDSILTDRSLVMGSGTYISKQNTTDPTTWTSGFINYITGNVTASGSYRYSDYLPVSGYNKIFITMQYNSSAGMAYYDASKVYISGQNGTSLNSNVPVKYDIPPTAVYVRMSIPNANTTKVANLINEFVVPENSIAYSIDGVPTVLSLGSSSTVDGQELISELPVSDGTGLPSGQAYIDIITRVVTVKP